MASPGLEPKPGWKEVQPFPFAAARRTFTADAQDHDRLLIRYYARPDADLAALVWFGPRSEGAPGHVHGGGILTVLDEAMGAACWVRGHSVMTMRLETAFRRPVPVGTTLLIETVIHSVGSRAVAASGRLVDAEKVVYAEGKGTFVLLSKPKVRAIFGPA